MFNDYDYTLWEEIENFDKYIDWNDDDQDEFFARVDVECGIGGNKVA